MPGEAGRITRLAPQAAVKEIAQVARIVSFGVLVSILLLIGFLVFEVMAPFLLPLFLAVVLAVIFRPVHEWVVSKCRGWTRLAGVATTAIILFIALLPSTWLAV